MAVSRREFRDYHEAADALGPATYRAFASAVEKMQASVKIRELAAAIGRRPSDAEALTSEEMETILDRALGVPINKAFMTGGRLAAKRVG